MLLFCCDVVVVLFIVIVAVVVGVICWVVCRSKICNIETRSIRRGRGVNKETDECWVGGGKAPSHKVTEEE